MSVPAFDPTHGPFNLAEGVRRAVASREAGLETIPAALWVPGQRVIYREVSLDSLHSPKREISRRDRRYRQIRPPIRLAVEIQPLGLRGQLPTVPLRAVVLTSGSTNPDEP